MGIDFELIQVRPVLSVGAQKVGSQIIVYHGTVDEYHTLCKKDIPDCKSGFIHVNWFQIKTPYAEIDRERTRTCRACDKRMENAKFTDILPDAETREQKESVLKWRKDVSRK